MIYTLTLNPAVDRELTVPQIEFGTVLRASASRVDFGGKGFNVSRLLQHMSTPSIATGFVGGHAGQFLQEGLSSLGIQTDFIWVSGETRTNVSIVPQEHQHYIKVNEAGPVIGEAEQDKLIERIAALAQEGDWWVMAGSLPPGVPAGFYTRIIKTVASHGAKAVLDCAGEPLQLGCAQGPYLVKSNAEEASELTGLAVDTPAQIATAAGRICALGAENVVISMGRRGALLKCAGGTWLAHAPEIEEKNPIGAGDALVGGMVWALSQDLPMREALGWGVASGAATASLSGTEVGSREVIEELFAQVRFEELD